jgi:hypothetical protein
MLMMYEDASHEKAANSNEILKHQFLSVLINEHHISYENSYIGLGHRVSV